MSDNFRFDPHRCTATPTLHEAQMELYDISKERNQIYKIVAPETLRHSRALSVPSDNCRDIVLNVGPTILPDPQFQIPHLTVASKSRHILDGFIYLLLMFMISAVNVSRNSLPNYRMKEQLAAGNFTLYVVMVTTCLTVSAETSASPPRTDG